MADVFISYKAEEFSEANWVKTTLEKNGLDCWMAPMSIPGGSNYAVEIPQGIRSAKVFVLILSERSQTSKWVPRELDQAINEGKTILPFMVEDCALRDDFKFYLSNVQIYPAYENKQEAVKKLIAQIRYVLSEAEKEKTPDPIAAETAVPAKDPGKKTDTASAAEKAAASDKTDPVKTARRTAKKEKKPREKARGRSKIKTAAVAAAALAIVAAVALIALKPGNAPDSSGGPAYVAIAGNKVKKTETYLLIKEAQLSAEDISSLSALKELSSVVFVGCSLPEDSLGAIFSAAGYSVELNGCGLKDSDLSGIDLKNTSVGEINLDSNRALTDLSPLSALGETLRGLSFNGCSVGDVSFAEDLKSLTDLRFDSNKVADLSPLSGLTGLKKLSISGNPVGSLLALSELKDLTELQADDCKLKSLDGLEKCIYLKKLYARDNGISDIKGIQNATLLKEVRLGGNQITDVSLLAKSKAALTELDLSDDPIADISSLRECVQIKKLDISRSGVTSLDALSDFAGLESLKASGNGITDVSGISGCAKLVYLDLSDNSLTNTDNIALDESATGVTLDLSRNEISRLVLPAARYDLLALYGNPLSDLSAVASTGGWKAVFDYDPGIDFEALSASSYYGFYVIDCPPDKQVSVSETLGTYKTHFVSEQEYLEEKDLG